MILLRVYKQAEESDKKKIKEMFENSGLGDIDKFDNE
jgi:hypothetical protein